MHNSRIVALCGLFSALLLLPCPALFGEQQVYFSTYSSIIRTNTDGSGAVALITGCSYALSVIADATYLYWSNYDGNTIGRAKLDGSEVNQSWITGCNGPYGLAIYAGLFYWANADGNSIARANIDGSAANQSWITGCVFPAGVTVDENYIFWANKDASRIGRARLDGTEVNQALITGCGNNRLMANDATYIYWVQYLEHRIGRAYKDGTGVNQSWASGDKIHAPRGIHVDADYVYFTNTETTYDYTRMNLDGTGRVAKDISGDTYLGITVVGENDEEPPPPAAKLDADSDIFWTTYGSGAIGHAKGDGTSVNASFITATSGAVGYPAFLDVSGDYVYWTNSQGSINGGVGSIGRAKTDGSDANPLFMPYYCYSPHGIAVKSPYIYYANKSMGSIGMAYIDGTPATPSFVNAAGTPVALAADDNYIYWSIESTGYINRAERGGSHALVTPFITASAEVLGLAVNATHIYWSTSGGIGRANIDGTGVDNSYYTEVGTTPYGLGLDGDTLLWAGFANGTIGFVKTDLSESNSSLISGAGSARDVAYIPASTAIRLEFMEANSGYPEITLRWRTATEAQNAGFHVWRSAGGGDPFKRITPALIPARGDAARGADYAHADSDIESGRIYYYRLEAVDLDGSSQMFGPLVAAAWTIALLSPADGDRLSNSSPPEFRWDGGPFETFELEFSIDDAFGSPLSWIPPDRVKGALPSQSYRPSAAEWALIREQAGISGLVYWRVRGAAPSGARGVSPPRWMVLL